MTIPRNRLRFLYTIVCLVALTSSSVVVEGQRNATGWTIDPTGHFLQQQGDPIALQRRLAQKLEIEKKERSERAKQRTERFLKHVKDMPPPLRLESVSMEQLSQMKEDRKLGWMSGNTQTTSAVSAGVLADPTQDYDKWAQAYRMLGGFIDCDHQKDGDQHSGDNQEGGGEDGSSVCSRWMMWASVSSMRWGGQ